ncbi:hypothetical protein SAMN05216421_0696 [Halopseudomonas xinjiangensis]|uniref:Uncharacterized protein n=1 Tax=Halopseudomonas xinjiangensis TaxID=487184 RepID=A0A1H1NIQ1_9GAMM|nr:hypothetical protein SAMN05216421_0696 [Halopseudomonas xinjiangensis]
MTAKGLVVSPPHHAFAPRCAPTFEINPAGSSVLAAMGLPLLTLRRREAVGAGAHFAFRHGWFALVGGFR